MNKLREHLAVNVMGAKILIDSEPYPFNTANQYQFPDGKRLFVHEWNPPENIEQAQRLLLKFPDWELGNTRRGETPYCKIFDENMNIQGAARGPIPSVICDAVLKATGYEGE